MPEKPTERAKSASQRIITELAHPDGQFIAFSLVAATWPEIQAVIERYGILWKDSPVPYWEPGAQAAAAHGMGPKERDRLMGELIEAAGNKKEE